MFHVGMTSTARDAAYRRALRTALLASFLAHAALLLGLPAPRQWTKVWNAPHIGFLGPTEVLPELNPQDRPVEDQEQLAAARRAAGAVIDIPVEFVPEPKADELRRPLPRGAGGRDRRTVPVLELTEDWALRTTSAPSSRSREFVILKMVRPEYPEEAIRKGVEGLIKIQAQVDVTGKVTDVRVLSSEVDESCLRETTRAMYLWKFAPYRIEGLAVDFSVIVPFRYRLE